MIPTIEWKDGLIRMLDQTKLPTEIVYVDCRDVEMVARGIRDLWIRGAPAIGIAAAMGVALGAREIRADSFDAFYEEIEQIAFKLGATRPTAVNLFWALDRMKAYVRGRREDGIAKIKEGLVREAQAILDEDIAVNRAMGAFGAEFLRDGDTVLTHCNAGSLATGGYGTALGVIRSAVEAGKRIRVYADETRPILQGARLTAWELMQDKIPVTLITDNMAGWMMKQGKIDAVIVGTDRTVANGDVANKIGTYSVAVLARHHRIPFYVAAPTSTIDLTIASGDLIPIEQRNGREITHVFGRTQIAPDGAATENPAFDVTPARLITGIVTEKGVFRPRDIRKLGDPNVDLDAVRLRP
ncbi:MAG: S-methyl-5-thioribose-1-phosphate isomerase [Nitrospirae bacterium RBG_16_64_22]|nr:MAG: S-methyl-5-thioribose-1-phosphate isomerase [Nitrospirae bacterium RBG_16_64_22]